jgi:hypothetical protein
MCQVLSGCELSWFPYIPCVYLRADCAAGRSEENRARRRQARWHTQQDLRWEQQATEQLNREALTEENGQRVGCRSQSD